MSSSDVPAKHEETKVILKQPVKVRFPRRTPSIAPLRRNVFYVTADKTTCTECPCFPPEPPYRKKPFIPCLQSPLPLRELAARVVDSLPLPKAFQWSVDDVGEWMEEVVGFPQYKDCFLKNEIDGLRLLMFEDISNLPNVNIRNFEHIKLISKHIHKLFSTEYIKFARSISLPARYPLTNCTWFSSRTGVSWGGRQNWSRTDLLRCRKILDPESQRLDHWDLVWYQKPDCPETMVARPWVEPNLRVQIPCYVSRTEYCNEYEVPRLFRVWRDRPEKKQTVWMERLPTDPLRKDPPVVYEQEVKIVPEVKVVPKVKEESRLMPKKFDLMSLAGKDFILAKRLMPKQKFMKDTRTITKKAD